MKGTVESIEAWCASLKNRIENKDWSSAQGIIKFIHIDLGILNEMFAKKLEDGED